jgi:hypothetical protein
MGIPPFRECLKLSITEMASKVLAKNHWTGTAEFAGFFSSKREDDLGSECGAQLQEKSQFASLRV